VGDSVRASLRNLVLQRLGNTDQVISSAGFFREQLAADLQARPQFASTFSGACPLIVLEGVVTHDQSGRRAAGVQVYGVDEKFWKFHGREGADYALGMRQVLLSEGLAQELGAKAEDALLVRVEKHSDIPVESLHGRKDDLGITLRLTTRAVLAPSALGEFSLRPQQAAVRAVFVPLRRLQQDLEQDDKVNTILLAEKDRGANWEGALQAGETLLRDASSLTDIGIKLRALEEQKSLLLESESAVINDDLAATARKTAESLGLRTSSALTYLANTIRVGGRALPYSLVTALDLESFQALERGANIRHGDAETKGRGDAEENRRIAAPPTPRVSESPPIILNEWAARDVGAKPGQTLSFDYYLWEEKGQLLTRTAHFQILGIVAISGVSD
jgi:hypothetical protein